MRPTDIRDTGLHMRGCCPVCGRWFKVTPRSEVLYWHRGLKTP